MGVHDYVCFCHSEEGEQCLTNHENCCCSEDESNDDISVCSEETTSSGKVERNRDKIASEDSRENHASDGYGYGEGYLVRFKLTEPNAANNCDEALALISDGLFTEKNFIMCEYSWDNWDFDIDGYTRNDGELGTEYREALCGDQVGDFGTSVWFQEAAGYWVVNVCPMCMEMLLSKNDISANEDVEVVMSVCSKYLEEISEKHNIPLGTSKTTFINTARDYFINVCRLGM